MAEPIPFTPTPAKTAPDAHDELQRLLQALHDHGLLRIATDIVSAEGPIGKILADGMNSEGARNAARNLFTVMIALGRLDPDVFYKLVFAFKDGAGRLDEAPREQNKAPGLTGVYKWLNDDELWRTLGPVIDAIKAFAARMNTTVEKPISDLTGKSSHS